MFVVAGKNATTVEMMTGERWVGIGGVEGM